jgi:hypothetical protein
MIERLLNCLREKVSTGYLGLNRQAILLLYKEIGRVNSSWNEEKESAGYILSALTQIPFTYHWLSR